MPDASIAPSGAGYYPPPVAAYPELRWAELSPERFHLDGTHSDEIEADNAERSIGSARSLKPPAGLADMRALPIEPIELNPFRIWQDNCLMGIESNLRAFVVPTEVSVMEKGMP